MEELNNKISGIRTMMKDMKAELYAIVNQDLVSLDEYTKKLYLKVLCTVVQYENNPSEMQVLYLKRILKGIGVEEPLEEYMRKALEIADIDIQEFISFMKENTARYYFTFESMLLVAMGNQIQHNYEYLAELIELCGITKKDLDYLSLVAKSVLQQESSYYEEAKAIMPEKCNNLNFKPYISNYYVGAVVDNAFEKFYIAPEVDMSEGLSVKNRFDEKKVTFDNISFNIVDPMLFEGCETVTFKNCKFHGAKSRITFQSVGYVIFEHCDFSEFENKVAEVFDANTFIVRNCTFNNCRDIVADMDKPGGVLVLRDNNKKMEELILEGNTIHNCYIHTSPFAFQASAVFLECPAVVGKMIVKDNSFSGCLCTGTGYAKAMIGKFATKKLIEKNNVATGELTRIFLNEKLDVYKEV